MQKKKMAVVILYYKLHFLATSMAQPLDYLVKKTRLLWFSVQEVQAVKVAPRKWSLIMISGGGKKKKGEIFSGAEKSLPVLIIMHHNTLTPRVEA